MAGRARPPKGLPKADPWKPPDWEPEDAHAIAAVVYGRASEDQQRRALKYIIETLCARDDLSYRPERPYDTAFAEGKRFVGNQIVKLANLNIPRVLKRAPTEQGSAPPREPQETPT